MHSKRSELTNPKGSLSTSIASSAIATANEKVKVILKEVDSNKKLVCLLLITSAAVHMVTLHAVMFLKHYCICVGTGNL